MKEGAAIPEPVIPSPEPSPPKVKGGVKSKGKQLGKKAKPASNVGKIVGKVMKQTTPEALAASAKRKGSRTKAAPKSPGKPSSAGKRSTVKASGVVMPVAGTGKGSQGKLTKATTDQMSMVEFKKYLEWHE